MNIAVIGSGTMGNGIAHVAAQSNLKTILNDRIYSNNSAPKIETPKSPDVKNIYNSNYIDVNAKEGQVFLWRSHNAHGYNIPNKGDERLTMSFNSMPKNSIDPLKRYSFSVDFIASESTRCTLCSTRTFQKLQPF